MVDVEEDMHVLIRKLSAVSSLPENCMSYSYSYSYDALGDDDDGSRITLASHFEPAPPRTAGVAPGRRRRPLSP